MTMTWGEFAQVLTAIAAILAAIGTALNGRKIQIIHDATNSMKDELVREVRAASLAEGLRQGRAEK